MPSKKPVVRDFVWSKVKDQYFKGDRAIGDAELNGIAGKIADNAAEGMKRIAQRLVDKDINLPQFAIDIKEQIKLSHRAMAILAYGGPDNISASIWGKIGAVIKKQYGFLENLINQVENSVETVDAGLVTRASLYGYAIYATFANFVHDRKGAITGSGLIKEAKRILAADALHCVDCPALAAKAWVPIKEAVPIGQSQCKVRCRCHFVYR